MWVPSRLSGDGRRQRGYGERDHRCLESGLLSAHDTGHDKQYLLHGVLLALFSMIALPMTVYYCCLTRNRLMKLKRA